MADPYEMALALQRWGRWCHSTEPMGGALFETAVEGTPAWAFPGGPPLPSDAVLDPWEIWVTAFSCGMEHGAVSPHDPLWPEICAERWDNLVDMERGTVDMPAMAMCDGCDSTDLDGDGFCPTPGCEGDVVDLWQVDGRDLRAHKTNPTPWGPHAALEPLEDLGGASAPPEPLEGHTRWHRLPDGLFTLGLGAAMFGTGLLLGAWWL